MSRRFRTKRKKGTKLDQAFRMAKSNRKTLRSEVQYFKNDIDFASAALAATPTVTHINTLTSITGPKGNMTSVQVRGRVDQNLASALNDDWRIDIVLDRQPNGALPTVLEIYGDATPDMWEYREMENKTRFKILRSFKGIFNESVKTSEYIEAYIKLNMIAVSEATTFGIGNFVKNSLVLVKWTTATANFPTFAGETRVVGTSMA